MGRDVDPYTNLVQVGENLNAFTGGQNVEAITGSSDAGSPSSLLSFAIGFNAVSPATPLAPAGSVFVGVVTIDGVDYYQYQDTSRWDPSLPSDGPTLYFIPVNDQGTWDPNPPAPVAQTAAPAAAQPAAQASPAIPSPDPSPSPVVPTPQPNEVSPTQPPRPADAGSPSAPSGLVQQTAEITITGDVPFDRAVSDPAALEAAEGRGHIQIGDVKQFFKGGYNGAVNVLPLLLGPILGEAATAVDLPKAHIDPRYGGAGIMGEQLVENLALEAAAELPAIGRYLNDAVKGEGAIAAAKLSLFPEAGGAGSRIVGDLPALGPEIRGSLPPEPLTTEAAALFKARDEAIPVAQKIVQQEIREGVWSRRPMTPALQQARFGTWLDALTKANIRQAVAEGRLPNTFVTSPTVSLSRGYLRPWIKAPDVWDTATGRAWDMMSARESSFYQHEASYLGTEAFGRLDPGGTTITEIFPLFHFGF